MARQLILTIAFLIFHGPNMCLAEEQRTPSPLQIEDAKLILDYFSKNGELRLEGGILISLRNSGKYSIALSSQKRDVTDLSKLLGIPNWVQCTYYLPSTQSGSTSKYLLCNDLVISPNHSGKIMLPLPSLNLVGDHRITIHLDRGLQESQEIESVALKIDTTIRVSSETSNAKATIISIKVD